MRREGALEEYAHGQTSLLSHVVRRHSFPYLYENAGDLSVEVARGKIGLEFRIRITSFEATAKPLFEGRPLFSL